MESMRPKLPSSPCHSGEAQWHERGSSSRQRERSEGWKRRHPEITRRSRCQTEAPEIHSSGQQEEEKTEHT